MKHTFLVFLAFISFISATEALHGFDYPGNETDHIALLAIKSQLVDHHPDGVLRSWNSSFHHCKWEGVTCGRKHKRVTVLDLNSRGLSGTISPFIANLSFLNSLYLDNNSMYGQIPNSLGYLFRLQLLRLDNNTLVGEIPANLSRCINLEHLNIGFNMLQGKLPTELRALTNLKYLNMRHNNLRGPLFDIIKNFTSVQTIVVTSNSFSGSIPNSISRMQNLIELRLGINKFSGTLPNSLLNLSTLQVLDFIDNQFYGELPAHRGFHIPGLTWLSFALNNFSGPIPTITNCTSLTHINFFQNSFTGRVPQDFRQFQNLSFLSFQLNYLEGNINFISTLVNCTQLNNLQVGRNNFSGILPQSVANLSTRLTFLQIGGSPISGVLPSGIINLINLRILQIRETKLTASIPHDLGKLQSLEILDLSSNRLTGKIPSSLGNLSRLSKLYLEYNKLNQKVPPSIRNCRSMIQMYLSYNELNGTLDKELFTGSATFVRLGLSFNHLEGSVPLEIGKQTNLIGLHMSKNKFSGVLPDGLSECTELQYLFMDGNLFYGDIPSSYGSLTSLEGIDFSQNDLSGPVPAFFSRIASIVYLNLSNNDFQGRVPTNSVFANATEVFLLGNPRLCGGIPELHLPKCIETENTGRKKKPMSHTLKLIVPIIGGLVGGLAMVIGVYLAWIRKKKRMVSSDLTIGKAFMKVSYDMLLEATSDFSSENMLGSGSFGSVFKGILDGKLIAVKVLNIQHHAASKSFMAECKALRNVRHRNLVSIITACSSIDFQRNDFRALVYEFMPNGSLDRWLHGVVGNMSLSQRVDVAIDVAHALNYLHHECETPIMHCDLKPSNILLDNDMVAHVGDFGLARFLTEPRHPNQSSTIGINGTVGYAAPEYGLGSEASTAGDVYSYGILLLELMTGKCPTDNMFKEDYNLHMYAEAALPDQFLQIVDPTLEEDNLTEEAEDDRAIQDALQRKVECIISVISVGVLCSNHLPHERMKIKDAISRLQAAKDSLLNTGNRRTLPARGARSQL